VERYDSVRGISVPMNKFQIEKKSRIIGRQTIHNVMRLLVKYGWVDVRRKEWRRWRESDHYILTDEGLYFAGELNIDLRDKIKERLGSKYHELQERVREARARSADPVLSQIRDIFARGGPPDFQWTLTVETDSQGSPRWQWQSRSLGRSEVQIREENQRLTPEEERDLERRAIPSTHRKEIEKVRRKRFGYRRDENGRIVKRRRVSGRRRLKKGKSMKP
jgi:hypothetical protein